MLRFSISLSAMEASAWRGLAFTAFLLNFVLVCQLLLLQPLVSASGSLILLSDLSF